jgi:hypothetical protein
MVRSFARMLPNAKSVLELIEPLTELLNAINMRFNGVDFLTHYFRPAIVE